MKRPMKILFQALVVTVVLFTFRALPAEEPSSAPDRPLVPLIPMMRQNFETVLDLQEYAASPGPLRDPKNYDEIVKLIDRLAGIAHVIPQVMGTQRPGLTAIATIYSEYLADLKSGLKTGNPIYLRNQIRTAAGFCFECHTSGTDREGFEDPGKRVEALKLRPFQKAEFLTATRQFDKALAIYKELLSREPTNAATSTELAHAVRNALILAVRVKQDPKLAQEILDRVEARKDLSGFFRGQLGAWKKDVSEWKTERPLGAEVPAVSWLEKARRLVDRARKLQAYPADHAGDVSYLRAIASTHQALARKADDALRAEAFQILGAAHAVLEDPLLWNLDEYYLEACIKAAPHTPTARSCFDRWMQETTFGYTGSAGTNLPGEEGQKLEALRQLAE